MEPLALPPHTWRAAVDAYASFLSRAVHGCNRVDVPPQADIPADTRTRSGARTGARTGAWIVAILLVTALGTALGPIGCSKDGSGGGAGADSTAVVEGSGDGQASEDGNAAVGEEGGNGEEESGADEDESTTAKSAKEKVTSVDATAAVRADLVVPVVAEGRIRARQETEIRAEIGGRLDRIYAAEGQPVKRGQILARLDGREYQVAIDEARSRYLKALGQILIEEEKVDGASPTESLEGQLEQLWSDERTGKISREKRLETQRELEVAALRQGAFRRDLVEARTGVSAAKADEERARLNLERTEIRAPFSGVITGLSTVAGQRVSAGETLCSIVDNVDVEAEVGVLESDLRGLEVGDRALLIIPALAETLVAKVDVISPRIDPDTRTCEVLIRYRSEDGRVRPGMFVRASIAGETFPDRLLVPREAVLTRDARPLVFRIDGDRARWVYVTLGKQNDYVVEVDKVLQGGPLEAGTQVVVSDHLTLTDEAKVKVRKTRRIQDPWSHQGTES